MKYRFIFLLVYICFAHLGWSQSDCNTAEEAVLGSNNTENATSWFYFVAPEDGEYVISSVGTTSNDTYVSVYNDCTLDVLAQNDDATSYQSEVNLALSVNDTIFIAWLDAFSSDGFDWSISQKTAQTITFQPLASVDFQAQPFALSATAESGLPVRYASSNTSVAYVNQQSEVVPLSPGTTEITAYQSGNTTYTAATPVSRTLQVTQQAVAYKEKILTDLGGGFDIGDIAMEGDYFVIGRPEQTWSVVFERQEDGAWQQGQQLVPDSTESWYEVGQSVSISGDTIALGTTLDATSGFGRVYLFHRDPSDGNWKQFQTIMIDIEDHDFGQSIDLDGNRLVVSSRQTASIGDFAGAFFVYSKQSDGTFGQPLKIEEPTPGSYNRFGGVVELDGNLIATNSTDSSYIFENVNGTWQLKQTFVDADGNPMGVAAIDGNRLLFSAAYSGKNGNKLGHGIGIIYELNEADQFTPVDSLLPYNEDSDIYDETTYNTGERFGLNKSLRGDIAIVSALNDPTLDLVSPGAAYVFQRQDGGSWGKIADLFVPDPEGDDDFGLNLAFNGNEILITEPGDYTPDFDFGAVHLFELLLDSADQTSQSISMPASNQVLYNQEPYQLDAEATSQLPLQFTSTDIAVANVVENGQVNVTQVGTTFIIARQPGNEIYAAAAPVVQELTVTKIPQVISVAEIPIKTFGDMAFNLNASLDYGIPPISYESSNSGIVEVSSTGEVSINGAGRAKVILNVAGNDTLSATSDTVIIEVQKSPQAITFPAIEEKIYTDPDFALDATVDSDLPLTFTSSDPEVVSISDQGVASIGGVGMVDITVTQEGNENYLAAEPQTQVVTVSKAPQSITFPEVSGLVFGNPDYTLDATVDSGLPLEYTSNDESVLTVSDQGILTIQGAGTAQITVSQAGNEFYLAAESQSQSITVAKAAQSITFPAIGEVELTRNTYTLDATTDSGLPLSFSVSNPDVVSISDNGVADLLATGTSDITASQPGNSNYEQAESVTRTITVFQITGVEMMGKDNLKLFPNPAKHSIYLETGEQISEVQVIDGKGVLIDVPVRRTESLLILDVRGLNSGVYHLKITDSSGMNLVRFFRQ